MTYDFKRIEKKWQKKWEESRIFEVDEKSKKPKYYVLDMFPYPSGAGLHMGHAFVFSLGDIFARFKRLQGYNVLYPIGYDALGLPAENAAIKANTHPKDYIKKSMANFMKQQKAMGWSYDWSRVLSTADPSFYKWDQWIFLKMFEKGLAYSKKAPVNWCPRCETILANEQVVNGKCWRHEDTDVEIKHLDQWFLKITDYADELLEGLEKINWPARAKAMQRHWIGKSHGTEIDFDVETPRQEKISNVVIVHGWCGHSKENWFPWIKDSLEKKGIETIVPSFPDSSKPVLKDWLAEMERYKSVLNENSVLIGHSLGAPTICKFLQENKIKVKKVIFVGPSPSRYLEKDHSIVETLGAPKEATDSLKNYLKDLDLDFSIVKNYAEEFVLYLSKDDPYVFNFQSRLKEYEGLGFSLRSFGSKGHFNEKAGVLKFPELLDEILSNEKWPIFTTRPDTIFGVTFMVVAAGHSKLEGLVTEEQRKEVDKFLEKVKSVSEKDMADMEKEGVFTGSYAVNPANGEKIPIYAGNFVVADYGSGMVMAVPSNCIRDYEFAQKFKLPVREVIEGKAPGKIDVKDIEKAKGNLINSSEFDGLESDEAKGKITKWLAKKKKAREKVQYKLRDWSVARQRYWGTPIPLIHCEKCGVVPVPEKDLPVELPNKVRFGEGNPLLTNEKWLNVKCPKCGGDAKREANTLDTFVNSSWYMWRYADSKNDNEIFDKKKVNYWAPIDQYIGGPEHITMHLVYARFYTKFLRDLGLLKFDEPALKYFTQGIVKGSDGEKMSKSKGNVVEPLETIENYGADSLRLYLMSASSPDSDFDWDEKGMKSSHKFVKRFYEFFENFDSVKKSAVVDSKFNKLVKEVTLLIENFKHNLAIIRLREFFSFISEKGCDLETAKNFLVMLNVFCPFFTAEIWERFGEKDSISFANWPIADEKKIDDKIERQEMAVEKLSEDINHVASLMKERGNDFKKVYVYVMPHEKEIFVESLDSVKKKTNNLDLEIFAVNDKDKYDPESKSKKAKPNRPSIYFE